MKQAYLDIKNKIEADCPSIKYVKLFNDQFNKSNSDDPSQNNQEPFPYPCVFIEFFGNNEKLSQGAGAKRLDVELRLYIGFESYGLEDTTIFDVAEEVGLAIENYKTTVLGPITYEAQRMDYNHNNVYIYELDYRTTYEDDSKYIKNGTVATSSPLTLGLNMNLDIDNIVIRSGNGTE